MYVDKINDNKTILVDYWVKQNINEKIIVNTKNVNKTYNKINSNKIELSYKKNN